ncbi:uncharacterized protein LOC135469349 [Liolophura sinensis]|uniref:uncharacterized protein LOC135469349 n=1 Tax=Liolophura sinensis TaxID=3198878 RepID=UPI0031594B79
MDADFAIALQLQEQFDRELANSIGGENDEVLTESHKDGSTNRALSIVDESWELTDPNPDIRALFLQFNDQFFWGKLAGVEVKWSPRMTLCAGLCCYEGRGGLCSIRLSKPLLSLRPRKDLIETLLHEMIHALLFVTQNNKDHDGHGPEFQKHMKRINKQTGTNITIYHNFHDEVAHFKQHWWRCDGPCQQRKPYFGFVKRAMNRAPSPRDFWWAEHQRMCGGTYTKVKEPDGYGQKKKGKPDGKQGKVKEIDQKTNGVQKGGMMDIRVFAGKGLPLTSGSSKSENGLVTSENKAVRKPSATVTRADESFPRLPDEYIPLADRLSRSDEKLSTKDHIKSPSSPESVRNNASKNKSPLRIGGSVKKDSAKNNHVLAEGILRSPSPQKTIVSGQKSPKSPAMGGGTMPGCGRVLGSGAGGTGVLAMLRKKWEAERRNRKLQVPGDSADRKRNSDEFTPTGFDFKRMKSMTNTSDCDMTNIDATPGKECMKNHRPVSTCRKDSQVKHHKGSTKAKSDVIVLEGGESESKEMQPCPVCQTEIELAFINEHLDRCLEANHPLGCLAAKSRRGESLTWVKLNGLDDSGKPDVSTVTRTVQMASAVLNIIHGVSTVTRTLHMPSPVLNITHGVSTLTRMLHMASPVLNITHGVSTVTRTLHTASPVLNITHGVSTVTRTLHMPSPVLNITHGVSTVTRTLHMASSVLNIIHGVSTVTRTLHMPSPVLNITHGVSTVTQTLHMASPVMNIIRSVSTVTRTLHMPSPVLNIIRSVSTVTRTLHMPSPVLNIIHGVSTVTRTLHMPSPVLNIIRSVSTVTRTLHMPSPVLNIIHGVSTVTRTLHMPSPVLNIIRSVSTVTRTLHMPSPVLNITHGVSTLTRTLHMASPVLNITHGVRSDPIEDISEKRLLQFDQDGGSPRFGPKAYFVDKPRSSNHHAGSIKYGELVILGYNGQLPQGDKGRRRSKFILWKRSIANGVKPARKHVVKNPQASKVVQDSAQHSVSYTLSRNQAVVVEYMEDQDTDMFQIGRSSEGPIDFVVMDTIPGDMRTENTQVTQSTISRFACRIVVDRNPPYTARIYAAGFDSGRNIFLGEKAVKWHAGEEIDGLTTNGVFIMHPKGGFSSQSRTGVWREVSIGGGIYALRESRSAPHMSSLIEAEDNILHDGTLIDLCGATLIWRSALGLIAAPSDQEFEHQIQEMNAGRPQCPVGLNTLVLPTRHRAAASEKQPYVYLKCGHVHGQHEWGHMENNANRTCPLCFTVGPFVQLKLGSELSFYVDADPPTFSFCPCAHMASECTVKFWSQVPIPHGCHGFRAVCPFCATPLEEGSGITKLIFQDHTD